VRNTFKWLASRSVVGGFATAAAVGLMAMAIPPGEVHDTLASVIHAPAFLLSRAFGSTPPVLPGNPSLVSWSGIFNGFTVLFYSVLWYVLLSVIVQIRGE
jgi:hypothetical protein